MIYVVLMLVDDDQSFLVRWGIRVGGAPRCKVRRCHASTLHHNTSDPCMSLQNHAPITRCIYHRCLKPAVASSSVDLPSKSALGKQRDWKLHKQLRIMKDLQQSRVMKDLHPSRHSKLRGAWYFLFGRASLRAFYGTSEECTVCCTCVVHTALPGRRDLVDGHPMTSNTICHCEDENPIISCMYMPSSERLHTALGVETTRD